VNFLEKNLGKTYFEVMVGIFFVVGVIGFILYVKRLRLNRIRLLALVGVLSVGVLFAWRLDILVERVHILEYGLLGWLACRDMMEGERRTRGIIFSALIVLAVGVGDELFQWWLPDRYGEMRDVTFNQLGGMWGIALFLVSRSRRIR